MNGRQRQRNQYITLADKGITLYRETQCYKMIYLHNNRLAIISLILAILLRCDRVRVNSLQPTKLGCDIVHRTRRCKINIPSRRIHVLHSEAMSSLEDGGGASIDTQAHQSDPSANDRRQKQQSELNTYTFYWERLLQREHSETVLELQQRRKSYTR